MRGRDPRLPQDTVRGNGSGRFLLLKYNRKHGSRGRKVSGRTCRGNHGSPVPPRFFRRFRRPFLVSVCSRRECAENKGLSASRKVGNIATLDGNGQGSTSRQRDARKAYLKLGVDVVNIVGGLCLEHIEGLRLHCPRRSGKCKLFHEQNIFSCGHDCERVSGEWGRRLPMRQPPERKLTYRCQVCLSSFVCFDGLRNDDFNPFVVCKLADRRRKACLHERLL